MEAAQNGGGACATSQTRVYVFLELNPAEIGAGGGLPAIQETVASHLRTQHTSLALSDLTLELYYQGSGRRRATSYTVARAHRCTLAHNHTDTRMLAHTHAHMPARMQRMHART